MKEGFVNYMQSYFETVDKRFFKRDWLTKLNNAKGFVPYMTHRPFTFDEFVKRCEKDENFNKRFVK